MCAGIGALHLHGVVGGEFHRKKGLRGAGLALAILETVWAGVAAAQQMAVSGRFDVTSQGAASYSIPIGVAPGTAGMIPALSLDYSSLGGDGIVGLGWSLGGLPAIGHCPGTMAQDGVRGSINYDANDRFCIEGKRLMAISGSYGADGTEYRTEVESFSRVISHGTAGTGPAWFEVRTKAGQAMEFGRTADSQMLATGKTTARVWAVDKITDTKGNYLTVTYTPDTANGQAYPARIDYTGNAAAGLAPYNSVQLSYATRPDTPVPAYQAGSLTQTTQRLAEIKAFAGTTLVNDYKLAYQQDAATGRSELTGVTQCGGDGSCLPATTFGWLGGSVGLPGASLTVPSQMTGNYNYIPASYDGSGRSGLLQQPKSGGGAYLYSSNEQGQLSLANSGTGIPGGTSLSPADWQGSGKTNVLSVSGSTLSLYDPTAPAQVGTVSLQSSSQVTGDFNGDGRADILTFNSSLTAANALLSNGDGSFATVANAISGLTSQSYDIYVGDWTGKGMAGIALVPQTTGSTAYFFVPNGNGTFNRLAFSPALGGQKLVVGDWNGDGKADFLVYTAGSSSTAVQMYLSQGDGTFIQTAFQATGWGANDLYAADWDGRGMAGILLMPKCGGCTATYYLSTGTGLTAGPTFTTPAGGPYTVTLGDWAGQGVPSLFLYGATAGTPTYQYQTNILPRLMTTITTGLGATTTITYQPLTRSAVYTKDGSAAYPTQDIQGAMYVVSRVDAANGVGGTYGATYSYVGGKSDLAGRGFLGFRQMVATDPQTGIQQTTTYRQDFPYLGLVSSRLKTLGSQWLNTTGTTYAATVLGSGRSLVTVQQSQQSSWDLDGSPMMPTVTRYQYDAYGNPTQVVVQRQDGASRTTSNTYSNDTTDWYLGRLTAASETVVSVPYSSTPPTPATSISVTYRSSDNLGHNLLADAENPAYATSAWYGVWDGASPVNLTVTVNAGVVLGAPTTSTPAVTIPLFPTGSTVTLVNNGTIVGRGGDGASSPSNDPSHHQGDWWDLGPCQGSAGGNGGPALSVSSRISVANNGHIWGGGGGGAAGSSNRCTDDIAGAGGGGAGAPPGGAETDNGTQGCMAGPGTLTAGGPYGCADWYIDWASDGGAGGGLGQAGQAAQPGTPGGKAGSAVMGNSNITWSPAGDRLGPLTP